MVSNGLEASMTAILLATILNIPIVFVVNDRQPKEQASHSPFVGSWSADMSRSKLDPKMPLKTVDLTIGVAGDAITVASSVVTANGAKIQERETLRADGTETLATQYPGVSHVANWIGPQVFGLVTKKGGEILALITYQISTDGQTLTARTSGPIAQTLVFRRSP
jgi:hypothetical protein